MEQKSEIETSELEESVNLSRDSSIPTSPIELEGCRSTESPVLYMSSSSDWHGSSTLTHLDTDKQYSLNRDGMSFADNTHSLISRYLETDVGSTIREEIGNYGDHNVQVGCSRSKNETCHVSSTPTCLDTVKQYILNRDQMSLADNIPSLISPYLETDAGSTIKEEIGNYGYHNAHVCCSSSKNEMDHEEGCSPSIELGGMDSMIVSDELMFNSKDKLCPSKDLRKVCTSFQGVKVLSSDEKNGDSSISTHVTERPSSIIAGTTTRDISDHDTEGPNHIAQTNKLAASRFPSSFSDFFFGRSQNARERSAPHVNPRSSKESTTMSLIQHKTCSSLTPHNESVHIDLSGDVSSVLMNKSFDSCSHDNIGEGLELSHCGVNLREWLEYKGVDANKNEKMLLFRQVVQRVDAAHSQGIAMLELQPSSFILTETGDVQYIGSLIETKLWSVNHDTRKKRGLEQNMSEHENLRTKIQNLGAYKLVRPAPQSIPIIVEGKVDDFSSIIDMKNSTNSISELHDFSIYDGTSNRKSWLTSQNVELEKMWYACPEHYKPGDLTSSNIYSLGLLLFEFLCHFESLEAHSAAMLDLHNRILPPFFLSTCPKEAGFCFWLLHPEPSSRPTTREVLQSDLMFGLDVETPSNNGQSCIDTVDDIESDLLLDFLVTLNQDKQNKACNLLESMKFLDSDVKMVQSGQALVKSSKSMDGGYDYSMKDQMHSPRSSTSRINMLRDKMLGNINELENAYFSARSNQLPDLPDMTRSDKDILTKRDHLSEVVTQHTSKTNEEKSVDRVRTFFDGICKFARYNRFEVCGTLRNVDILNLNNAICSLCFDLEEEYIAAAGVSKKIKIFELRSLLDDCVDVHYPVLEMSNNSKFSCICWNRYMKNYLASTDYDGVVQIWDASIGQGFGQYKEHQKRGWSVDFSHVDPRKFASGGDDCCLKIWSMNERNSIGSIWNPANICCVQFSSYSSHLLAFGSADYRIYMYDLRHTRIPWCTLVGHENAVSYVRFLDSETLVSASTDNTLKLWDLKRTSLDRLCPDACRLTFRGHTNVKNFVGLTVLDGYIVCGSETNEVYAYYKLLPMPITSHKFGCTDPISGDEVSDEDDHEHFVSSVCWSRKSQLVGAANSTGSIKIMRLV